MRKRWRKLRSILKNKSSIMLKCKEMKRKRIRSTVLN